MRVTMTLYLKALLLAFIAVWVWAAINPSYRHDWLLENYLVFIFVPIIILTGRYFRLSDASYTLLTLFMILHVIGSHYTYAEVPFGYELQKWLATGATRDGSIAESRGASAIDSRAPRSRPTW